MATEQNGRPSKIEELLIKYDLRMGDHEQRMVEHEQRMAAHEQQMGELRQLQAITTHALENTEKLLVLEGDRIDRLERIADRQNELFAVISEQLQNLHRP